MDRLYNTLNPQYRGDDRSCEEIRNGMRGGEYWTPSNHPTENDFENIDVVSFLFDKDEPIADGGETPEEMMESLYELPTNGSEYSLVQGRLYDHLTRDCRVSEMEAMNVARELNRGRVEKAEELVHQVLEE